MKTRNKRSSKSSLIVALIALAVALILTVVGAVMRMDASGMSFGEALAGFIRDTFRPVRKG